MAIKLDDIIVAVEETDLPKFSLKFDFEREEEKKPAAKKKKKWFIDTSKADRNQEPQQQMAPAVKLKIAPLQPTVLRTNQQASSSSFTHGEVLGGMFNCITFSSVLILLLKIHTSNSETLSLL